MTTFSVVIPTLWRCQETIDSITQLCSDTHVTEVIVIDNDRSRTPQINSVLQSEKVKLVTPYQNLYVGESWNLGTRMAKENHICLLSDDIVLHNSILQRLQTCNFSEMGILGLAEGSVSENPNYDQPITIAETDHRSHGYGVCMFYNRQHYVDIPASLRVFFTDDWLFASLRKRSGKANYVLNCSVRGRMSVTSREFNFMFHDDGLAYAELMRDF